MFTYLSQITAGKDWDQAVNFFDALIPPFKSEKKCNKVIVKALSEDFCRISDYYGILVSTSLPTTLFAPIIAPSPIWTPGRMTEF